MANDQPLDKLYDKRTLDAPTPESAATSDPAGDVLYAKRLEPKPAAPTFDGTDPLQLYEKRAPHSLLNQIAGRDRELFSIAGMMEPDRAALRDTYLGLHGRGKIDESLLVTLHHADVTDRLFHAQPHEPAEVEARAAALEAQFIARRSELDRLYGKDAEPLVDRVQRFLEENPELGPILERVGTFPGVVDELAAYVHANFR